MNEEEFAYRILVEGTRLQLYNIVADLMQLGYRSSDDDKGYSEKRKFLSTNFDGSMKFIEFEERVILQPWLDACIDKEKIFELAKEKL